MLQGDLNRSLRPVGLGCPNLQKQLKRGGLSVTGHAIEAWFLFALWWLTMTLLH
jgi:hypothetical protein